MSLSTTQTPTPNGGPDADVLPPLTPSEADRSCRWPVLALLVMGATWLLPAGVLAMLASIKVHAPGFLAGCAHLTYGRVQPAAWNAFVYGFASQVGLALAVWLTCRLSRAPLAGGRAIIVAALFWNVGVKIGMLSILFGSSTGVETLEFPQAASITMFVAYLIIAAWAGVTFHQRRERAVYVTQWYLLAALFGFPWFYAAANLLAVFAPVRGVLQAAVQAWYAQNLSVLWLGSLGLGSLFYFVPKLTGLPIPSRNLAVFGFWTLVLFGGFGGLQRYSGGPFPSWMLSASVVGGVLMLVPVLAAALNLLPILRRRSEITPAHPALRFLKFAAGSYFLGSLLSVLTSFPSLRLATQFTLATTAVDQLLLQGFAGMALLGGFYFLLPVLAGRELPSPALVRVHFRCAAGGVLLLFVTLGVGGLAHGAAMNDAAVPFINVVKRYLPFVGTASLANLILLAGDVALTINLIWLLARVCRESCLPAVKALLQPIPAEVKA